MAGRKPRSYIPYNKAQEEILDLMRKGVPMYAASGKVGQSRTTLQRWRNLYDEVCNEIPWHHTESYIQNWLDELLKDNPYKYWAYDFCLRAGEIQSEQAEKYREVVDEAVTIDKDARIALAVLERQYGHLGWGRNTAITGKDGGPIQTEAVKPLTTEEIVNGLDGLLGPAAVSSGTTPQDDDERAD